MSGSSVRVFAWRAVVAGLLCLVPVVSLWAAGEAAPGETRRHLRIVAGEGVLPHAERILAEAGHEAVEISVIERRWVDEDRFGDAGDDPMAALDAIVGVEMVTLVEVSPSGDRFSWVLSTRFDRLTDEAELLLWDGPEVRWRLGSRIELPNVVSTIGEMGELGDERFDAEVSAREPLVVLDVDGREIALPQSRWSEGDLDPADRELVDLALEAGLGRELDAVLPLLGVSAPLSAACTALVAPLIGGDCPDVPPPTEDPWMMGSTTPDCAFDASFGEPCSPEQLRRQKRELAD